MPSLLDRIVLVFNRPQDPVNIAATVRVMKNMGVSQLRLVNPEPYDPWRIEGVAHGTRDLVSAIQHFDSLPAALADCVLVAAFAGKRRAAKWPVATPREMAAKVLDRVADGPVALLFGQEDHGLPNEALDLAQLLVTIPTTEHASLNLAQAVMVACYELHLAAGDTTRVLAPPRKDAPPPTHEEWELALTNITEALTQIRFFRTRNEDHVMRTIRSLLSRADPNSRELTLVRAAAIEVMRTIDRMKRGLEL
ncbi:MAG: tRNA (cytosine(32)/uridine(32)-2'-O)-methyltransferase TrmJ [Gemmatimonadetes bacterium]|nr:tRNA (cytosine(32)/uridine(32)-2'-O)-methyltransferase TrmJ [Gemmatimonadota bacterium]